MDGKTHSDYRDVMGNMMSQNGKNRLCRAECLGWGLLYGVLAALPLCGLLFFLQITRPAHIHGAINAGIEVASLEAKDKAAPASPVRRYAVARLKGVSAELGETVTADAKLFSASEAVIAFGGAYRASVKPGFKTEFVTRDHHRIAIRIIRREAVTDRAMPDNTRLMDIVQASTANTVRFVWGNWVYTAEVQDKGIEPEVVVQEVL
jgi:hypothetical protein